MSSDAVDELEAIDDWHSQIGDEDIRHLDVQALQRIGRRPRRADARAGRLQHLGDEAQRIRLVVDRQHVYVAQIWSHRLFVRRRPRVDERAEDRRGRDERSSAESSP